MRNDCIWLRTVQVWTHRVGPEKACAMGTVCRAAESRMKPPGMKPGSHRLSLVT